VSTPLGKGWLDTVLEGSIVGSFTRLGPSLRKHSQGWKPLERLDGKTVVVTGATSGLGAAGIRTLAELGAYVVGIGRNQKALDDLQEFLGNRGETWRFDLADLRDTQAFATRLSDLDRLDVVLSNAGALLNNFTVSPQNVEVTLAVHLLSPYLLTTSLASRLTAEHARFIFMTSGGMYTQPFSLKKLEAIPDHYKGSVAYARVKRGQVVLTGALQHREPSDGASFYAVHPGWTATPGVSESLPLFNTLTRPLLRTPKQGVDGALWLASHEPTPVGGGLWLDREERPVYRGKKTVSKDPLLDETELLRWLDERLSRALA
jgi:NAD(P)-dependent dehydrogenase (short-subunit alcohol dehydrogenase family)